MAEDSATIEPTTLNLNEKIAENFIKLGGDPIALTQVFCFLENFGQKTFKAQDDKSRPNGITIENKRFVTINDLTQGSFNKRLYLIDLKTAKVESFIAAHGIGGQKGVARSHFFAEEFSNVQGSNATPRGFFITGTRRNGSSDPRWKYSMNMHGIQSGINDLSFKRNVLLHPFPFITDDRSDSDEINPLIYAEQPYLFLSKGCIWLSEGNANSFIERVNSTSNKSGGSLLYNFTPDEKSFGPNYCGENLLIKN